MKFWWSCFLFQVLSQQSRPELCQKDPPLPWKILSQYELLPNPAWAGFAHTPLQRGRGGMFPQRVEAHLLQWPQQALHWPDFPHLPRLLYDLWRPCQQVLQRNPKADRQLSPKSLWVLFRLDYVDIPWPSLHICHQSDGLLFTGGLQGPLQVCLHSTTTSQNLKIQRRFFFFSSESLTTNLSFRVALTLLSLYKVSVSSRVADVEDFRTDMKRFVENIARHCSAEKLLEKAFMIQMATRRELNLLFNANKNSLMQKGVSIHQKRWAHAALSNRVR